MFLLKVCSYNINVYILKSLKSNKLSFLKIVQITEIFIFVFSNNINVQKLKIVRKGKYFYICEYFIFYHEFHLVFLFEIKREKRENKT